MRGLTSNPAADKRRQTLWAIEEAIAAERKRCRAAVEDYLDGLGYDFSEWRETDDGILKTYGLAFYGDNDGVRILRVCPPSSDADYNAAALKDLENHLNGHAAVKVARINGPDAVYVYFNIDREGIRERVLRERKGA